MYFITFQCLSQSLGLNGVQNMFSRMNEWHLCNDSLMLIMTNENGQKTKHWD